MITGEAMSGNSNKKDELEVSSAQLQAELIEIKERVGALDTIASISHKDVVEKFVRDNITTDKARQILKECEEPRTREYLIAEFNFRQRPGAGSPSQSVKRGQPYPAALRRQSETNVRVERLG